MRRSSLALIAVLAAAGPVAAQDFFQDFESFVEEMLPEQQAPRTERPSPAAEPVEAVTPTPVEQRPEAEAPAAEAEGAEPPLPRPRPEAVEQRDEEETPEEVIETTEPSPDRVYQTACPALLSGRVIGEMLAPIAEGMCGERSPLSVTAVVANGRAVELTSPVTTNCAMAGALADWVSEVDAYAKAALDSDVVAVTTGTSFMCRNRYGAANGFVSEHGFANAVDVVGFRLGNGEAITVEADWLPAAAPEGRLLRQAHGAACGRFTTVLGPEANAEHEDHLHLDLGCHGQSCTAQICE